MQSKVPKSERIVKAPLLPKRMAGKSLPPGQLLKHEHYSQLALTQDQWIGQTAERVTFEQCVFKQVGMSATTLTQMHLVDSRLNACDLANAIWSQADFLRSELVGCRMTGFQSVEARYQDVLFKDCQAMLAQFRFATFKAARFEDCDLSNADFQGADLTGVAFIHCDLQQVEMSGAKLMGADLRGCKIDGMRAGWKELQGALVDPQQAVALVKAFGIIVEWPEKSPQE